jgi:hypothetical protein
MTTNSSDETLKDLSAEMLPCEAKCTYMHAMYIAHVEVKYIWLKCTYINAMYKDHVEGNYILYG